MAKRGKVNCWEHFDCKRSRHGKELAGTYCPVSLTSACNGINGGIDAGRICWEIEGTFCTETKCGASDARGGFEFKEKRCSWCEFKSLVRAEEKAAFKETRYPSASNSGRASPFRKR
ncbi:MAG: hypothetical protein HQL57_04510 [Magnetococcales bacterium]|nr:hypothetical protein [Magnetococcales bacterium]